MLLIPILFPITGFMDHDYLTFHKICSIICFKTTGMVRINHKTNAKLYEKQIINCGMSPK